MQKIKVIDLKGIEISFEEYQKKHNLKGNQIAKHFSLDEAIFKENLKEFGELVINEALMLVFDETREMLNAPIIFSSFNRTSAYQKKLIEKGYRAAKTSPHVVKMAGDADFKTKEECLKFAQTVRKAAKKLGIKIRVGWVKYRDAGQTFVHVDVCPHYYSLNAPFSRHDVPQPWRLEINW